ncbi:MULTISPECIES: hypothetical protein [unclassified Bradyrhizobium]|uniref:hypothetical protein n=1 Tax=unclassified Bradyrhizobium TaxID=2631580 RepID=UPI001FFBF4A3|nr:MULTISPECIES: hypothetical protein [unclassified Bradyrhizobium]MCK1307792.1 hypothetical protein [Bradyrhizobium sp. 45]MCK1325028.1 hypothetical protein [Bradyrhizobium sp. 156]MCK1435000.1 hypothetical protein [Bradyrhizobium sp. 15]MCK1454647.1 hypothetical protein [Bradyrhizobium sp. 35]MCK1498468.1 hypothetical protein [Bradyrhizobium sp. 188]
MDRHASIAASGKQDIAADLPLGPHGFRIRKIDGFQATAARRQGRALDLAIAQNTASAVYGPGISGCAWAAATARVDERCGKPQPLAGLFRAEQRLRLDKCAILVFFTKIQLNGK